MYSYTWKVSTEWCKLILYKLYAVWWRVFSMEETYNQYSPSVWRRCIISTVERMQYGPITSSVQRRVCNTWLPKLQAVVGGCIYLGKWYFTDNITQNLSHCDKSRCSLDPFGMLIWLHLDRLIIQCVIQ